MVGGVDPVYSLGSLCFIEKPLQMVGEFGLID